MTARGHFRFGEGYTLDPAGFEHKVLAENWTAWDADHAGRVDPRFWLEQDDSRDSYIACDRIGPVMFFKVIVFAHPEKTAELHMQFMPASTQTDHERIRNVLLAGCPWIERILAGAGVTEIVFDSNSAGLVAFSTKRLGFTHENGQLRKRIAVATATAGGNP